MLPVEWAFGPDFWLCILVRFSLLNAPWPLHIVCLRSCVCIQGHAARLHVFSFCDCNGHRVGLFADSVRHVSFCVFVWESPGSVLEVL